jgi:hypothetical protein
MIEPEFADSHPHREDAVTSNDCNVAMLCADDEQLGVGADVN